MAPQVNSEIVELRKKTAAKITLATPQNGRCSGPNHDAPKILIASCTVRSCLVGAPQWNRLTQLWSMSTRCGGVPTILNGSVKASKRRSHVQVKSNASAPSIAQAASNTPCRMETKMRNIAVATLGVATMAFTYDFMLESKRYVAKS